MSDENRRTETARQNDDSEMIENIVDTPSKTGRAGGNLQTDVATQAALERVSDPDAMEGVTAEDDRAHGQDYPPQSRGAREG